MRRPGIRPGQRIALEQRVKHDDQTCAYHPSRDWDDEDQDSEMRGDHDGIATDNPVFGVSGVPGECVI